MKNPTCPICGHSVYIDKYEKDGCYICAYKPENTYICGTIIGCKCTQCNTFLPKEHFGLRNDVYECKTCGKVQWGYTEYMRSRKEFEEALANFTSINQSLQQRLKKKIEEHE